VVTAVALCAAAAPARAATPSIRVLAGALGTGAPRDIAQEPMSVAYAAGRVYLADPVWNVVRRIDAATGAEDVVAGTGNGTSSGDGHSARAAGLDFPEAVALRPDGALLIGTASRLRLVRNGVITTLAGGGTSPLPPAEGLRATDVALDPIRGIAVAPDGSVYFSQPQADRVLRLATDGTLHLAAGTGVAAALPGPAPAVAFPLDDPLDVAVDRTGALLVADYGNDRVVRVDASGLATVVASLDGPRGLGIGADGAVLVAKAKEVVSLANGTARRVVSRGATDVAAGGGGDLWFVDESAVYRRRATGAVAAQSLAGYGRDRVRGGDPARLQTYLPTNVAVRDGAVYWTDGDVKAWRLAGGRARLITANDPPFWDAASLDPERTSLLLDTYGIAVDEHGRVYVSDSRTSEVYLLTKNGRRKVAGRGSVCIPGATDVGDGGLATSAYLCSPAGLAVSHGRLYIADTVNHRIRVVDAHGRISTFAGGNGVGAAGDGGQAKAAQLNYPDGVTVAPDGSVYVADTGNHVVRRIARNGVITTVAGVPGKEGYAGDGGRATSALLSFPESVAVAADGTLYIAEEGNDAVRRVRPDGTITTLAGGHGRAFSGDGGAAADAALGCPSGLALDEAHRTLVVADTCNHRLRAIRL
jgi:sugar lactone lactonase YvrE